MCYMYYRERGSTPFAQVACSDPYLKLDFPSASHLLPPCIWLTNDSFI